MEDIILSKEQKRLVEYSKPGPLIIRGVAGSGKTTVGIKRVSRILERAVGGDENILMVTYQKTLKSYLQYIIDKDRRNGQQQIIWGDKENRVDVKTIDQLIHEQYKIFVRNNERYAKLPFNVEKDYYYDILDIVLTELKSVYNDLPFLFDSSNRIFLLEEISYINSNRILTKKQYQIFDRKGRDKSYNKNYNLPKKSKIREAIYRLRTLYVQKLLNNNKIDFQIKRLLALRQVKDYPPKQYTHLIIDESQDLDRVRIDFLKYYISDQQAASVTFLYDTTQSIYSDSWLGNNHSFKSLGLDVKGKSFSLKKNFRTTYEIQDVAQSLISASLNYKQDIEPELINRSGVKPVWAHCNSYEEQITYVITMIHTMNEYIDLNDVIVLARTRKQLTYVKQNLEKNGIECFIVSNNSIDFGHNKVRLMTLHASKGLESEAVFIINMNSDVLPLHKDKLNTERKLLYVGMTRATKYLFLTSYGNDPSSFIKDIDEDKLDIVEANKVKEFKQIIGGEEEKKTIRRLLNKLEKSVQDFDKYYKPMFNTEEERLSALSEILKANYDIQNIVNEIEKFSDEVSDISSAYEFINKLYLKAKNTQETALHKISIIKLNPESYFEKIEKEMRVRYSNFEDKTISILASINYKLSNESNIINKIDWGPELTGLSKALEIELRRILLSEGFTRKEIKKKKGLWDLITLLKRSEDKYSLIVTKLSSLKFSSIRNKGTHDEIIKRKELVEMKERLFTDNGVFDLVNNFLG